MKLSTAATLILLLFLIPLPSCKVKYSMTGGVVCPEAKNFSVQLFPNRAPLVNPTLSNDFTEALKDFLIRQTSLTLTSGYGDLNFEGEINRYDTQPVAIEQGDLAAMTRLTIGVKVKYTTICDQKQNFEQTFTRFVDYPSSQTDATADQVRQVIDQITQDIFNRSLVNW